MIKKDVEDLHPNTADFRKRASAVIKRKENNKRHHNKQLVSNKRLNYKEIITNKQTK